MIELAIMLEGQNGLNWERWMRWAQAVEDLGFAGLYRSDHFTNPQKPDLDSLELWVSLTWLASHTSRIEFGPLVSPVSFRNPVFTARMGLQVDDLSNGRLRLGVGAGWQEREHAIFGFDLLSLPKRFARFEEGLQVITRLLKSDEPVSFDGRYYRLDQALLLPRPKRPGGPPIVIGGGGMKRTLPLVACYADEWNADLMGLAEFMRLNRVLDTLLQENGRQPGDVKRTKFTRFRFGRDDAEIHEKLRGRTIEEYKEMGGIAGTAGQLVEQIGEMEEAGIQRVMIQWLDLDDMDSLERFAAQVLSQFTG